MNKSIGEKIRDLRINENLTQEALAEALNVSFQSVSRWENGMSSPDISLIPVIAKFFDVSTDTLFGMNEAVSQQDKEKYESVYAENRRAGKLGECLEGMMEARRTYPRDCHIMINLAEVMDLYEGGSDEQQAEYRDKNFSSQIHSLCSHVLDEGRNEMDRCRASKLLCRYFERKGNISEALKIANGMADMLHSKEILLGEILCGEDKQKQLQTNMLTAVEYVAGILVKIAVQKEYGFTGKLSVDEKIDYIKAANDLYRLLIPDENYLVHHRDICWNYRRLAKLYLIKQDRDTAYECLVRAEKHARLFDELDVTVAKYTSVFLSEVEYKPEEYGKCWEGTELSMLSHRLDEMSAYFEGYENFNKMRKRLKGM